MTVHVDDEDDGHWSVCVMRFYFGVLLENHSVVVFQCVLNKRVLTTDILVPFRRLSQRPTAEELEQRNILKRK